MKKKTLKRILGYVRPYLVLVALSLLCAAISAGAQLLIPIFTGDVLDLLIGPGQVVWEGLPRLIAHIAAALTEQGYTPSIQAAFSELLSPKHGLYCPPRRPDAFETISMIRSMGAVSVLAHPFLNLKTEASLREFLVQAKERGLDAMETLYPLYDSVTTRLSIRLTEEFDLLQSGGSDFHGANKPDIRLGRGRGELAVPGLIYDKMKKLLQTR